MTENYFRGASVILAILIITILGQCYKIDGLQEEVAAQKVEMAILEKEKANIELDNEQLTLRNEKAKESAEYWFNEATLYKDYFKKNVIKYEEQ